MAESDERREYEYVVVGSGAGGGTVAARLAEAGRKVLVLEAGGDPRQLEGGDPLDPEGNRLPEDYDVPAFHAFASENKAMKWDFFVRHYADEEKQKRDPKYDPEGGGVLYPRAGALGGCTAHNAMILMYPANSDWDAIAELTGDPSWRAEAMRGYFEKMEDCRHRTPYRRLFELLGWNPTRHGFGGWLRTDVAIPKAAIGSHKLRDVIVDSAVAVREGIRNRLLVRIKRFLWALQSQFDPNDWRLVGDDADGIRYAPLTTREHRRYGTRERLLEVARERPDRLTIELDALATRVLFDDDGCAVGVEYLKGANLYRASGLPPAGGAPEKRTVRASREVILAGGAFNTPQLLMLSGVGPREELEKHGIPVRVDLPGVGKNLQDRYEVGVVNRMKEEWDILRGARFAKGDPQYEKWLRGQGVYITNGTVMGVVSKSAKAPRPDLFLFALMAPFRGYQRDYSKPFGKDFRYLTWAILKAHTNNTAGEVTLRSADPRDPPRVDFHYFDEGNDAAEEDLEAVVDGIEMARRMGAEIRDRIEAEELPGDGVQGREALRQFVKDHAWGHHASCTCPIGPREQGGVLGGNFRVHGTEGLRVVDASVFPRIPGIFIVSAVYMIGEKASDVILADAGG